MLGIGFESASAILMARIVDRAGEWVRQEDVVAIQYSIYEIEQNRPGEMTVVNRHEAVALDVEDVIVDALRNGGGWSDDGVGYNFRHEVDLGERVVSSEADGHVEIRYVFTPLVGEKMIVRFQLKVV